jgi:DNA-binding response OmpR family regulator
MSTITKLKILALGTATTLKRLYAYDVDHTFDLVGLSLTNEVVELARQEHFDVILVDSACEGAFEICRTLSEISYSPVALVVRDAEADWQNLCSWSVDGFISDDSGKTEMVARITALARRCHRAQPVQA